MRRLPALALPLLAAVAATLAVSAPAAAQDRLTVGVVERPPYASEAEPGVWSGLGVDLWRLIAETEGLAYDLEPLDAGEAAAALEAGRVDVALGLDATAALERRVNVVHPFHTATLGIAEERESQILRTARGLVSWELLGAVASLSVLLLLVGALVWLMERRRNGEQFHRDPVRGLGDGFWWAGVTLTTIGYGDKAPATLAGRAVAMLWMLVGLAVSASLTAAVVAAVDLDGGDAALPGDLVGVSVGARTESGAAAYLDRAGVAFRGFEGAEAGLAAVDSGLLDVYVDAAPTLRALRDAAGLELAVKTTALEPHYVAMATAEGSPLGERLDRAVLARISGPGWPELLSRHLPSE